MKKKIAIIGAGIAGLTLANLIKKFTDHEFMVYEREESLSLEEGYGIQLAINSVKILSQINFNKINDENVFYPKPKVKSSFIRLVPKKYAFNNKDHEINFYNVVKAAFEGRRKMIKKSLVKYLSEKEFNSIKIDPNLRAEDLSVNDYIYISEHAKKI